MIKWVGIVLGAAAIFFAIRTLNRAGSFKSINNHLEGSLVEIYPEAFGAEDLDMDYDKNLLFISSCDRRKVMTGENPDDGIFLMALNSPGSPKKIATTFKGEFHPHGISFLKTDSISLLFVVNHNRAGNFVELFEFKYDSLIHIQSFSDSLMCCPNDVAAVDRNKFYVTNDHGNKAGLSRTLEEYLQIPQSYLLYFNGDSFSKAWTGVNYANGVTLSRDKAQVFLATTTGRSLFVFNRNTDGKLELVREVELNTGIDNITVDPDGNLWIGAHPKMLDFVAHAKDPKNISPSQVLKLMPAISGGYFVKEIYLDDGNQLSGSSVALHAGNELFVGAVFDQKLLRITLNK